MAEKKSIADAIRRAKQLSEQTPGVTVYVLDKFHQRAVVCASKWVYHERLLDGYYTFCMFRNGGSYVE